MLATLASSAFFLFLLQTLTEFVAAVYAFGLMGTHIPPEIGTLVLLLSPFLLALWRRRVKGWVLPTLLAVLVVARLALPLLPTRGVLWVGGIGAAAALLALPLLLRRFPPAATTLGLAWAVAAAGLLRAAGAGIDLATTPHGQAIGWGIAVFGAWGWWASARRSAEKVPTTTSGSLGKAIAAALGIASALFLLEAAFAAPAVIARWGGWQPLSLYGLTAVALAVVALAWIRQRLAAWHNLDRGALVLWAALLVGGLFSLETIFPANLAAYPYTPPAPRGGWAVLLAVLAFGLLFSAFYRFSTWLREASLSSHTLGVAFGLAALYLLLLIFAHVCTTTYDYIPVVGPLWRDRFWVVYAVPATVTALAVFLFPGGAPHPAPSRSGRLLGGGVLTMLALAMVGLAYARSPHPQPAPETGFRARVLTFNIQQGYRADGQKGWEDQLALMRQVNADIIGLQESDTARLSGANNDLVGYFATALGMYAYYGPPTVNGTFGIALLSRYPILEAHTAYMTSQGEQTAVIVATLSVNQRRLHVAVTHLGNDGPMVQQMNVLQAIQGRAPLVLMGDFNFTPNTPQYRRTVETLQDAWLAARQQGGAGHDAPPAPIDHIFITPDLTAPRAAYLPPGPSDHPALWAVIENP